MTIDIRKVEESVEHLKKFSPEYDNVLAAIKRELKARHHMLARQCMQFPDPELMKEMTAIINWLLKQERSL